MTILGILAIGSSVLVVTASNTVISVLWLVVVFILTSLILGLLGLGYAALLYVIVYVGAIAILFLFVVQLLGSTPSLHLIPKMGSDGEVKIVSGSAFFSFFFIKKKRLQKKAEKFLSSSLPLATILGTLITYITYMYFGFTSKASANDFFANASYWLYSISSSLYNLSNGTSSTGLLYELGSNGQVLTESIHTAPIFFSWSANIWGASQVINLAEWLYGGATLPLIIASVILLLAMVAPIVLCKEDSL